MCDFLSVNVPVVAPMVGEGGRPEARIFHGKNGLVSLVTVYVNPRGEVCGVCTEEPGLHPAGKTERELYENLMLQFNAALMREHIHETAGETTFCGVNQATGEGAGQWA